MLYIWCLRNSLDARRNLALLTVKAVMCAILFSLVQTAAVCQPT